MLERVMEWFVADWALKVTALALAFLLWVTVRADTPGQWETDIPVRVQNTDPDWVIAEQPTPREVRVVFRGPWRELLQASAERPEIIVPIEDVNDTSEVIQLRRNWVRMPPGTESTDVALIQPDYVRVTFDPISTRLLPVAAQLTGEPALGFEIAGTPEVDPSVVRASGAGRNLGRVDTLRLPPIDVRDWRNHDTVTLTIDTTGTGLIISPRTVRVIVPVRPILADTGALGIAPQVRRRGGG